MARSTPEYETLRRLLPDLKLAVQNDLVDICLELQATDPRILTPDNGDRVTNVARMNSPAEGSAELMAMVRTKVEGNAQCYHALVRVLEKKPDYYKKILVQFKQTFQKEEKRTGDNSPQKTEPDIPEICLSNADLAELLKLLRPAAAHWQHIAPLLVPPLPDGTIAAIQYENSGKPDSARHCLREMLSKWVKLIKPRPPSWQSLKEAVDGAVIDGGDVIVAKIDDIIIKKAPK